MSVASVDARRTTFVTGASPGLDQVITIARAHGGFELVVTGRSTGTLDAAVFRRLLGAWLKCRRIGLDCF